MAEGTGMIETEDNDCEDSVDDEEDAATKPSMDTHLPENNVGYKLLLRMGWSRGMGLGREGEGRVDPIRIILKEDTLGVGKADELESYHVDSTAKRKALESEIIAEESEDDRFRRLTKIQKVEAIKEEIKSVTAAFYCDICQKQYNKIAEYEAHLSSYDHHHRKRFKELKEMSKKGPATSGAKKSKKEEKERAREEKELRRLQEATLARDAQLKRVPVSQAQSTGIPATTRNPTTETSDNSASQPSGPSSFVEQAIPDASATPPSKLAFGFGSKKPRTGGIKFAFNKK
ncbi:hypothetical protein BC832DRAFT_552119 [Gaertneriomyces semiglobifer]|nr:hypothetical protein BC832DRAFT_552119 [Gaertneriomyces semiglobifer]